MSRSVRSLTPSRVVKNDKRMSGAHPLVSYHYGFLIKQLVVNSKKRLGGKRFGQTKNGLKKKTESCLFSLLTTTTVLQFFRWVYGCASYGERLSE